MSLTKAELVDRTSACSLSPSVRRLALSAALETTCAASGKSRALFSGRPTPSETDLRGLGCSATDDERLSPTVSTSVVEGKALLDRRVSGDIDA